MDEEADRSNSPEPAEAAPTCRERACAFGRMALATLLHGVGTGLIGIFIAELIRKVQELAYGNDAHGFLEIALEAQPWRRMCCVTAGGIFGALAWYWLRGLEPAFVTVEDCMDGSWMPPLITLVNGMIQDIVVALGGSFGREAAPREIAAMWACVLAEGLRVPKDFRRILVACGTGAGLAAVYSVPVSGVLYTIEHVLNWDVSLRALVPAIVTSCIATAVAAAVVETGGLYAMKNYSYQWPSLGLVLWGVIIGPISALAAMAFRRFVKCAEQMKPQARLPLKWTEAVQGVHLTIDSIEREGNRMQGLIVERGMNSVKVCFPGKSKADETYSSVAWHIAHPVGRRDWKILLAMPTIFLALGILSHDFPSLLGNGRALAEVAIHRQRTSAFFMMLLFLKAMMTSGSIGAGAAGGTLTPSVALGATVGAVLGETLQFALPEFAPRDEEDAPMSVIAASAFLAVAMRSPVTSLWLLMEFSAQGVSRADMLAALRGDFGPLLESKLALGMLVPMAVAVVGAIITVSAVGRLSTALQPPQPPPPPSPAFRTRASSTDLDLGIAWRDEESDNELGLDESAKDVCFTCFGLGLLLNTCLTVGVAAAAPACHAVVTKVSALGVGAAAAVALLAWCYFFWKRRRRGFEPLLPVEDGGEVCKDVQLGGGKDDARGTLRVEQNEHAPARPSSSGTHALQNEAMSIACAVLVALGGAVVPLAPWVLHVWRDVGGGLTALVASTASAVAAGACGAAMNALRAEDVPAAAVGKEVVSITAAAVAACAVGTAWHFLSPELPEGFSIEC